MSKLLALLVQTHENSKYWRPLCRRSFVDSHWSIRIATFCLPERFNSSPLRSTYCKTLRGFTFIKYLRLLGPLDTLSSPQIFWARHNILGYLDINRVIEQNLFIFLLRVTPNTSKNSRNFPGRSVAMHEGDISSSNAFPTNPTRRFSNVLTLFLSSLSLFLRR